jgi:hypothetical protein
MCILAAAIMLPMIPLEVDEVVAMGQHMAQAKRRGDRGGSLWKIFWMGGSAEGCTSDERSPQLMAMPQIPGSVLQASIWGMTLVGVCLMFIPTTFGLEIQSAAADIAHLGGALIVTVSVIAMGEVVRLGRYCNALLGLGVAALPWFVSGGSMASNVTMMAAGSATFLLSIPRGPKLERYGLWDRYVH